MDQPTSIEIIINGKQKDVQRAIVSAEKRIYRDTIGFDESLYVLDDSPDFDFKKSIWGRFCYTENEDGTAEYDVSRESYGCIYEEDIEDIANEISAVSPDVEFHINAVITVTYADGYDLHVDIDYVNGNMDVNSYEEYYEYLDDEDDEE